MCECISGSSDKWDTGCRQVTMLKAAVFENVEVFVSVNCQNWMTFYNLPGYTTYTDIVVYATYEGYTIIYWGAQHVLTYWVIWHTHNTRHWQHDIYMTHICDTLKILKLRLPGNSVVWALLFCFVCWILFKSFFSICITYNIKVKCMHSDGVINCNKCVCFVQVWSCHKCV